MHLFYRLLLRCTALCLMLCLSHAVWAIDERYEALPLKGNQLRTDSGSMVQDDVYFNLSLKPLQTTWLVRNLITFSINEDANLVLPDTFNVTVNLSLTITSDANGDGIDETNTVPRTLQINYSKLNKYRLNDLYTFTGGYKVIVTITGITVSGGPTLADVENALILRNEILVNREYSFSCTNNAIQTINKNTSTVAGKGELEVSWNPERAADEYDLEWSYLDITALPNYYITGSPGVFD